MKLTCSAIQVISLAILHGVHWWSFSPSPSFFIQLQLQQQIKQQQQSNCYTMQAGRFPLLFLKKERLQGVNCHHKHMLVIRAINDDPPTKNTTSSVEEIMNSLVTFFDVG